MRGRRTRIVATLGPASRAPAQVLALALAGADVFRVNFSHGDHADHAAAIAAVRSAEAASGRPLAVLADLQGPKFRLGRFAEGRVELTLGQMFRLDISPEAGDRERVELPHPEVLAALAPGALLLVDDGRVRLEVLRCGPGFAETRVLVGDRLSDRKGVNLPGAAIPVPALTDKDLEDLRFALEQGVDWVALSFVQRAADMADLRRLVAGRAGVLAKIEKPAALEHLEEILDQCQAIMIARGDLGVELDPEEVPVLQKRLVRAARSRGMPVVVATQMLESMVQAPAPTRAEASDVANAVYEGADAVMLSAETASGAYPLEAVSVMDRVIRRVECDPRWPELMRAEHEVEAEDVLVMAAAEAATRTPGACIAAFSASGQTALRLSRLRPLAPMLALSPSLATSRRLALVWGVEARLVPDITDADQMVEVASGEAGEAGLAVDHRRMFVLAGVPMGSPGAANVLRLAHLAKPRVPRCRAMSCSGPGTTGQKNVP